MPAPALSPMTTLISALHDILSGLLIAIMAGMLLVVFVVGIDYAVFAWQQEASARRAEMMTTRNDEAHVDHILHIVCDERRGGWEMKRLERNDFEPLPC
ncbi:hypothetical protein Q8F55_000195 [Vanrija albida]|uniref:Uncharacterized protein n=1 Tax=Vanrija albida TaxID=181172 RepID=A0ABR3QCK1_9TREE